MAKIIIALSGIANVGKSDTIRQVKELLISKHNNCGQDHDNLGREAIILTINNVKVGIEGQGDPNGTLQVSLELFLRLKCEIIICATRTKGQTVNAVNAMRKNGYEITFLKQIVKTNKSEQETSNRSMAIDILERVEKVILANSSI